MKKPTTKDKIKSKLAKMERGKSLFINVFVITIGFNMAQRPTTTKRLKKFEPTTLLIAISFEPFKAAEMLTATSGADVPIETIVKPIITLGTLKIFVIELLPSTKRSAPLIKKIKPSIRPI